MKIVQAQFPRYRELKILEAAPDGPVSEQLKRRCPQYVPMKFLPEIPLGQTLNGARCENLERMTFTDGSFDIVITQDVLEHVLNPDRAFAEIARVLKAGGGHVFTVPFDASKETRVRAKEGPEGVVYLDKKEYHGIVEMGSLVVTEWGRDLPDFIFKKSGLITTIYDIRDSRLGIEGEGLEVFVSRKNP